MVMVAAMSMSAIALVRMMTLANGSVLERQILCKQPSTRDGSALSSSSGRPSFCRCGRSWA